MRRFTLLELMITVAIVALLAAIAIPMLHDMQLEARVAEQRPNSEGLRDAVVLYALENPNPTNQTSAAGGPRDLTLADKQLVAWGEPGGLWDQVGWAPTGDVRCTYGIYIKTPLGFTSGDDLSVSSWCDVDDDDNLRLYSWRAWLGVPGYGVDDLDRKPELTCTDSMTGGTIKCSLGGLDESGSHPLPCICY